VAIVVPPVAIEEAGDSLEKILTELGVRDDSLSRATDTLAAAQGLGREVAEDVDKHIVCEAAHCVPLVGGLLHLKEPGHHPPKR
jgi:hypothetical protein